MNKKNKNTTGCVLCLYLNTEPGILAVSVDRGQAACNSHVSCTIIMKSILKYLNMEMDLSTLWLYPIPASRCCFPQSITAERSGIASIPGFAPAMPMCFRPPPGWKQVAVGHI